MDPSVVRSAGIHRTADLAADLAAGTPRWADSAAETPREADPAVDRRRGAVVRREGRTWEGQEAMARTSREVDTGHREEREAEAGSLAATGEAVPLMAGAEGPQA